MSRRRSGLPVPGRLDTARVGAVATRAGLLVVAITLPVAVGSAAGLLADGGTVTTLGVVISGSPAGTTGLERLFRTAVLGVFGGCWLLGAGLLADGLLG